MAALFGFVLLTLLLITAVGIIRVSSLFAAVLLSSIFSMLMAGVFFVLDAADVALTEAAIGAGVSTVLYLGALALTTEQERMIKGIRLAPLLVVSLTAIPILYATFDQPRLGDPTAVVHQHVAPWYLEQTPVLIGIPNVVTAVLASFRGYDTLGEVVVIMTAGIGVLSMLGIRRAPRRAPPVSARIRHHAIPRVVVKLLIPFIALFALYVQFHGEYGPGGGFQAGAILAGAFILFALLEGYTQAQRVLSPSTLITLMASGVLIYIAVGIVSMLRGASFLDYSVLHPNPVTGQQLGILLVEVGVALTVLGVLLSIFYAFLGRRPV